MSVDRHGLDAVLRFTVEGMPQTKGSWRPVHRRGRVKFLPDNDLETEWAARVAWTAKAQPEMRGRKVDAVSRFDVRLYFELDPTRGKKNRRDLDKLVRSCLDALTGIVWADDEQVDGIECSKSVVNPGEKPGVEIWVFVRDFG